MQRTTTTRDLSSAAPKRQNKNTEMETKIGNKMAPAANVSLCPYEKMKMEVMKRNAEKMKAQGFDTSANKFLQEKYDRIARGIVDDVTTDAQPTSSLELQKEISKKKTENRAKQSDMHTMGPKSLALLREQMRQNDPSEQEPSRADVYIESRKRKPERTYLTQNEEILQNIEKMKALKTCENRSSQTDPYDDVITKKEHHGRVRTYDAINFEE